MLSGIGKRRNTNYILFLLISLESNSILKKNEGNFGFNLEAAKYSKQWPNL
jgi:hypothetical protein